MGALVRRMRAGDWLKIDRPCEVRLRTVGKSRVVLELIERAPDAPAPGLDSPGVPAAATPAPVR